MKKPCNRAEKRVRLEIERQNLIYALIHAELTYDEGLIVRRRLEAIEAELFENTNSNSPSMVGPFAGIQN